MEQIKTELIAAVTQLIEIAKLHPGAVLVVGCSSSEVHGAQIGSDSSFPVAEALVEALMPILQQHQIQLAAQCCEHLNRALIVEREVAQRERWPIVSVLPQPKAGGSFATAVYAAMKDPVAVEEIEADAGLDIGSTLIGMHLKRVAVPVRLATQQIGEAAVTAARTRPKYIGGPRAFYEEK